VPCAVRQGPVQTMSIGRLSPQTAAKFQLVTNPSCGHICWSTAVPRDTGCASCNVCRQQGKARDDPLFPKHAVGLYLRDGWKTLLTDYTQTAFKNVHHLVALELQVIHKLPNADALQGPCHRSPSNRWLSEGSQVPVSCLCPVIAIVKDSTYCPEEEIFSIDSHQTLVLLTDHSNVCLVFCNSPGPEIYFAEVSPALYPTWHKLTAQGTCKGSCPYP
jgi:hypothetical protein